MRRALRHPGLCAGLLAAVLSVLAGCSNVVGPGRLLKHQIAGEAGAPAADTPVHLLLRLKWAWEHQDAAMCRDLFTDDYVFVFAAMDSAGQPPFRRVDELSVARHLFAEGTATEPRANRITLDYVSELVPRPDRRPGKTWPWHQELLVRTVLRVYTDDQVFQIDGSCLFFVVSGDSALIPEDLQERGFGPDPNRWYIERWEDRTDAALTGSPRPAPTAAVSAAPAGPSRPSSARAAAVAAGLHARLALTEAARAALGRAMDAADRRAG